MHAQHCPPTSTAAPRSPLPSPVSLLLMAPRLVFATLDTGAGVIRGTLDGSYDRDRKHHCQVCHGHHAQACCNIPETHCPAPCHIHWQGGVGDSLCYQLQITNRSGEEAQFTLTPETFPVTGQAVSLSRNSKTLAADESFSVRVTFSIPEAMAGGCYQCRIHLTGAYEEYILVSLAVKPQQDTRCHIEQGATPKRIRAHHWYHHFQWHQACVPGKGLCDD